MRHLTFCTNTNVISKHGIDVHHNTIFGKTDIRVPLPPAYVRELWDYGKANAENIKKAISSFNWSKAFENLLNETLLNIFKNYIPNKKN